MKKTIITVILAVLVISSFAAFRFSKYYSIACDDYADKGVKGRLSSEINVHIAEHLNENSDLCSDIIKINKLNDGMIGSIEINASKINHIANQLTHEIYEQISSTEYDFGVPLGNALGSKLFSSKGPKIKFNVTTVGAVSYEIKSELITGGINQTLHRVYIVYTSEIKCIAPFYESKNEIKNTVIIAETLIVGNIPEVIIPKN